MTHPALINATHSANLGWDAAMLENRRGFAFGAWSIQKLERLLRQIRAEQRSRPGYVPTSCYTTDSEV